MNARTYCSGKISKAYVFILHKLANIMVKSMLKLGQKVAEAQIKHISIRWLINKIKLKKKLFKDLFEKERKIITEIKKGKIILLLIYS